MISTDYQDPEANAGASGESEAPASGAPGWRVPRGRPPFVLRWEGQGAEITPALAGTLDQAAAAYRRTRFAWLRFVDPADAAPALSFRRALAVRDYLRQRHIWSVPLRRQGREWVALSWQEAGGIPIDGLALTGPFRLRASRDDDDRIDPPPPPPPPTPVPLPPPPENGVDRVSRPRPGIVTSPRLGAGPPAPPAASAVLASVRSWLTPTKTLTKAALQAMTGACLRLEGELTAECQAAVDAGEEDFAAAPEDARAEFSLLLAGCRTLREGKSCAETMGLEREFRALPRGRLDPRPLKMQEDVKTTFIARILYAGDRSGGGRAGVPIGDTDQSTVGGTGATTVIPFSGRMCFSLTADPADFLIRQLGDPCPQINEGGGRVKYDPQWEVTPLRAGKLELKLATQLFVNQQKREYRHEPYPLIIEVAPKPSLWDWLDATIKRATGTVNLAVGLAEALGALFAAIAAWGIWAFFRRRKGSPPPPST